MDCKSVAYIAAAAAFSIGLPYVAFRLGEPRAVWFYCDILQACR